MDKITRRFSLSTRFYHLLRQPLRRGMRGHSSVQDLARSVVDDEKDVEGAKPERMHREQVTRSDSLWRVP